MNEQQCDEEDWYDDDEERIWRQRRDAVQKRVTAEDFAIFTQQLENIEARIVGKGLDGSEGEDDKFIFHSIRSVIVSSVGQACGRVAFTSGMPARKIASIW